jgi:hypothetical protein
MRRVEPCAPAIGCAGRRTGSLDQRFMAAPFYLGGKQTNIVGRTGVPSRHSVAIDVSDVATICDSGRYKCGKGDELYGVPKCSFMLDRDSSASSGGPQEKPRRSGAKFVPSARVQRATERASSVSHAAQRPLMRRKASASHGQGLRYAGCSLDRYSWDCLGRGQSRA